MKILVAADMEGISGVVHWDHVDSSHADYARFRKLMTGDVNAAVQGAFEAGAQDVLVADGHGNGRNILIEELDSRVRLYSGSPASFGMVQGIDSGIDAAMFVGYHAKVGATNGILDHTWSGTTIANVWFNGRAIGEVGLNATMCGHFGVPVVMVSGDQTVCAEAQELLGRIETAVVKRAQGRLAAECLPPAAARGLISAAASRAVERWLNGDAPQPLGWAFPITVTVGLVSSDMADRVAVFPGSRRLEEKTVEFLAEDAETAYRIFRTAAALARP